MPTKTRRIPRSLKKQLEANLTKLTAYEAGRLFVIYLVEWSQGLAKRQGPTFYEDTADAYAPVIELMSAFDKRVKEARNKPNEKDEVLAYNGFLLLREIAREANVIAERSLFRLLYLAEGAAGDLRFFFFEDWASEIAHYVRGWLSGEAPTPVSREEYDRMIEWSKTKTLEDLGEIAGFAADTWAEEEQGRRGFEDISIGQAFWEANRDQFPDAEKYYQVEAADLRRVYVEVTGRDRVLRDHFKGDEALLNDWLEYGGVVGVPISEIDAKGDEIYDDLVKMVEAGDLAGGEGVGLPPGYEPVLIQEGTIPASVALRVLWPDWLRGRGIYARPHSEINSESHKRVIVHYGPQGDLTLEEMKSLVAEFIDECRSKPWGEGITREVDLSRLTAYLSEDDHPMIVVDAPGVGRVSYDNFRTYEGDEGHYWETRFYATVESLTTKAEELAARYGAKPEDFSPTGATNLIQHEYYPAQSEDQARETREELQRVARMIDTLRMGERIHSRRVKFGNSIPLDAFFGAEIATPVERAIKNLGDTFGELETFKQFTEIVSDDYFGGLPILLSVNAEKLRLVEERLKSAEDLLDSWVQRMGRLEGKYVDLSPFTLTKQKGNEETVRTMTESVLIRAELSTGLYFKKDYDFGRDKVGEKAQ